MDRNTVDWRGYIPAITTPFTEDGAFDAAMMRDLLDWLHGEGMHGLVAAGTTGEWFSLEPEEFVDLLRCVGDAMAGKLTLIAGCNAFTARQSIEKAKLAAACGFDGILLTPPPYVVPSEREIITFYRTVSDAIDLPICVYNWPPGTNIDMSMELLEQLADIDNVVAIKNSTGDMAHFVRVFFALKDRVRIFGFTMDEFGATLIEHHGGDGTMGAGAILGRDQPDFYNYLWERDRARALACGAKDRVIMTELFNADYSSKFGSPQALFKEALNLQGLPGGYPRPPLLPLTHEQSLRVRKTLVLLGRIRDDAV